ncbi:hypothetical protein VPH35_119520 [Triticum aestivum]
MEGLVVVVPMAVPFTFMQGELSSLCSVVDHGLKFDVGWAHKFDVCSYRFLSKPAETKFSSADHTELSQFSVSLGSVGGSALVQRQVLGIPQHKQRQMSVDATAVDDALKLSSVTDSACCCSLRSLSAENRQYN